MRTLAHAVAWLLFLGVPIGLGLLLILALPVQGRDRNVPAAFQREFPCPSTGKATGACPGWERDHIIPLCRGGADTVANMHWLSTAQHKLKTRGDCRRLPG